jgi:predicted permease
MSWRNEIKYLLRKLNRNHAERELEEELHTHLELETQEQIEEGLSPREAREAARRAFGSVALAKEQSRSMWGFGVLETIWQDLRYGARMLVKARGFSLIAVITLALGVGVNISVFSVLEAVLLKPLPYHEPDRLVWLTSTNSSLGVAPTFLNPGDILDYREQAKSFAQIASWYTIPVNLSGGSAPERVEGVSITPNFFQTLGIKPLLGRDFKTQNAVGENDGVIISYGLWQRQFGGDPGVIGRKVVLAGDTDAQPVIIGVMPADLNFPPRIDMFASDEQTREAGRGGTHNHRAIARLKSNVTPEQAQAEISVISRRQSEQFPDTNRGWETIVTPFREHLFGRVTLALPVLFGATLCVLLIACANVANLQLVRTSARTSEIALRAALGAGRWRLVRQLLIENLLLFAVSGIVGLLVAIWGVAALRSMGVESIPRLKEVSINPGALAFTILITALTGVIFGMIPARQSLEIALNEALRSAGNTGSTPSRGQRIRGALAATQFALAMTLVVVAGLLLKSFLELQKVNPGFQPERLLTAGVSLNFHDYRTQLERTHFFEQALERLRNLPEVEAVAATSHLQLGGRTWQYPFRIAGQEQATKLNPTLADYRVVTRGYFETMQIPIRRGRAFTERDHAKAPLVALIDESFARNYFFGRDPIGQRLGFEFKEEPQVEIIGVAGEVKHRSVEAEAFPTIYICNLQTGVSLINFPIMNYVIQGNISPESLAEKARRELQSLDPNQVVFNVRPMEYLLADAQGERRFTFLLLALFAALALTLAVVGVYGVMSYSVVQRTREIGVRMALGAQADDVLWMIVRQGMKITLLGAAIGLTAALALTRVIKSLLFNVSETDLFAFGCAVGVMTLAASFACYLPARRAARVDPISAIRE